jgi:hypothetical protein
MFEFLFCPVHGLLRPDNLAALASLWQQGWILAFQAMQKFRKIL